MLASDGLLQTRLALTELRAHFWSGTEILMHLNVSAKRMCSKAQNLQSFFQFTTEIIPNANAGSASDGAWQQEYALPIDIDNITRLAFFSGTLFPIQIVDAASVQLGGRVGGIPWYGYIKPMSRTLTPQVNDGSIARIPLTGPLSDEYHVILGLYPVPQSGIPVYIWYVAFHPTIKNPQDRIAIPDMFMRGWYAYAVARCKEKEGALEDAKYWDAVHEKETESFIEWSIDQGLANSVPQFSNSAGGPGFLRGSTSVLVVAQNPGVIN